MENLDLYRLRILILDDDHFFGKSLRTLLECQGAEVELRSSITDTMSLLEGEVFDVIILDFQLPGNDGPNVARQIRSSKSILWAEVPLIGLTGHDDPELRDISRGAGMNGFFVKPSGLDELLEDLRRYVQSNLQFPLDEKPSARFRSLDPSGALFQEMIELFKKTSADYILKMKEALGKNDIDVIRNEAHKMKSSSQLLGAFLVGTTCEFLEKNSSTMSSVAIRRKICELERLRNYMLEDLSKLSSQTS